jgi:hypothetical protein
LGEEVEIPLDRARQNLQLEVPGAVDRNDSSDLRVGIVIADHDMPTDAEIDIAADIGRVEPTVNGRRSCP